MNHSFAAVMKTRPRPAPMPREADCDFPFDTTFDGAIARRDASRNPCISPSVMLPVCTAFGYVRAHEKRLSLRSRRRNRVRALRDAARARRVAAALSRQRRRLQRSGELAERSRLRRRVELLVVRPLDAEEPGRRGD